jgi:Flp pilus assembly protein TadG
MAMRMFTRTFPNHRSPARLRRATAGSALRGFSADQSGATVVAVALLIPVLIGAMGIATEIGYWQLHQRAMHNAADAAAIAAATNAGSNYANEAKAVAAQYGFPDGTGNITVTASNPSTASGCAANCYVVQITDNVPLFLSEVVGYRGTGGVGNHRVNAIAASTVAMSAGAYSYCVLALGGSGAQGITSNGAPKANLQGCTVMSNTGATCNGNNLNASIGDAHGTNKGCGITQNSNVPVVSDPYSGLAKNIPSNSCSSYPQEPAKKNDPALPSSNQWSGTYPISGNYVVCGDQQLTGNTTINAPSGAVLVIENGQLDTNGWTLQTANGSGLTVVFTGSNNAIYQHTPTGGGTLNITAPTSGVWSGVAIYQDPSLTTNVDISAAGNSPNWNISGLVYLPHSSVTMSGAVGKSSQGASCLVLVTDNITINGTGSIFANNNQCSSAGLTTPQGGHRGTLVN